MTVVKDEIVLEQKSFFLRLFHAVKGELLTKFMRKMSFLGKVTFRVIESIFVPKIVAMLHPLALKTTADSNRPHTL